MVGDGKRTTVADAIQTSRQAYRQTAELSNMACDVYLRWRYGSSTCGLAGYPIWEGIPCVLCWIISRTSTSCSC